MPLNIADLAGGFIARAGEELIGYGVGTALSRALEPEATRLAQLAWASNPDRRLEAADAADIVAQGVQPEGWGADEAASGGIGSERFSHLAERARSGPSFSDLLNLWRRGSIGDAELVAGLNKLKLGGQWHDPLKTLKEEPLQAQQIATAIQRGIIKDPGFLPVAPPTSGGNVPPMPQANVDALVEAAWSGHSAERLAALTRIIGLPPAPGELLSLLNRGHITETDFYRGVAEGNTRNEWGPFLLQLRKELLSPSQYAELHLRGWIDQPSMVAGAAQHGIDEADVNLLHSLHGRPLPVHQVQTGLERGGTFGGDPSGIPAEFLAAVRQSNVRPEWYHLAYANRHSLPSPFVTRGLLRDGAITEVDAERIFRESGWPPDLAKQVATAYAKAATPTTTTHVPKAESHLWNALHRSYVNEKTDQATAEATLTALGVAADEHAAIIELWNRERVLIRKALTPAQIRKALKEGTFTTEEAVSRMESLGFSAEDASTFLAE